MVFISDRGENRDAWVKRFDGTTPAEVLLDESAVVDEAFLSPDGEWLVYRRGKEDGDRDIYAIRPGAAGDISLQEDDEKNDSIAWVQRREGPYNPSPLLYDGYLYVLYDRGYLACFDALTGERAYKKRVQGGGPGLQTTSSVPGPSAPAVDPIRM